MNPQPAETAGTAFAAVLDDGECHEFETQESFDAFIAGTPHGASVKRARDAAGRARRPNDADVKALKAKTDKIDRELTARAERLGLAPYSRELFERVTVKREPSEPEIFDATLLFEGAGFGGGAAPVYGDIFDLNFIGGWGGRVRSLLSDRSLILYSQPGFRGLQYWVFVPRGNLVTLADLGWFSGLAASLQYQA